MFYIPLNAYISVPKNFNEKNILSKLDEMFLEYTVCWPLGILSKGEAQWSIVSIVPSSSPPHNPKI